MRSSAMTSYRQQFRPGALQKPHAILAVAVVCADTDAEAETLASTVDLNFVRRSRGEYLAARKSRRKPRPSTMRRSTASASGTTARACLSARQPPCARGCRR